MGGRCPLEGGAFPNVPLEFLPPEEEPVLPCELLEALADTDMFWEHATLTYQTSTRDLSLPDSPTTPASETNVINISKDLSIGMQKSCGKFLILREHMRFTQSHILCK